MAFNNRLKEARINAGLTQEQLGDKLGMGKSTIAGYEKGNRDPNMMTVQKIMNILKVDANFLWQDEMEASLELVVSSNEWHLIKKYRTLDDHGKTLIETVLDKEHDRCVKEQELICQPKKYVDRLPNIASAGIGDYLFDDIPFEKIEIDEDCQADFAIGVDGDSMEPTYTHDDVVLVKKQDTINIGEIGIFIIDGECFIKEYAKDRLISHNKNYKDKELKDYMDIRTVGKVIGKI